MAEEHTKPAATSEMDNEVSNQAESTGKGKAAASEEPASMTEEHEEDSESEPEDAHGEDDDAELEEDNMEEIDENNIIADGRRTRGKTIDFAKAAENLDKEGIAADEDDEDDEDFEHHDDSMHD